jgi:three-Cys-motif partner protein
MAKKPLIEFDPDDGLVVSEVGAWASEKHARVKAYIEIASATRRKYLPPPAWHAGAAYIELSSGPGRSVIRDTTRIIDGSPLVALKAAKATVPFSKMLLNDLDPRNSAAVTARIRALGEEPLCFSEPADEAVDKIIASVNPSGLRFAFLDPFNLEGLSFEIIRKLSRLKVDMLIHVSVQDLQRNLDSKLSKPGGALDIFAPGWRSQVDQHQAINSVRADLMKYWMDEIEKLGTMPAKGIELIVGSKRQRLYWLVFVSGHDLARKFWEAIRDPMRQQAMDF